MTLRIEDLRYTYPGAARAALEDVSLVVEPGELVLIAGGSGSGKSTLLRAACGLVPHFHGGTFGGRVETCGLDTRDHGPAKLAAVAGTLFQDPETQVVMGTVRAEIAFGLENLGWAGPAVARGVEEAALALGLGGLLDRPTHELSGGELQRVALAASLAGRPKLLLLDEPTSQLDPVAGDELLGVLRRLNEEWGTAILLAEHRLERCLPAADRVLELRDGRLVADETPRAWLARTRATPAARLFALAGLEGVPVTVKEARRELTAQGWSGDAAAGGSAAAPGAAAADGAVALGGRAAGFGDAAAGGAVARFGGAAAGGAAAGFGEAAAGGRAEPFGDAAAGDRAAGFGEAAAGGRAEPFGDAAAGDRAAGFGEAAAGGRAAPLGVAAASDRAAPAALVAPSGAAPRAPSPPPRGRRARKGALLSVENVWLELRDGPAVLRGVTVHARPGERIALMGRNGAGKSTLLKVIAGLLDATRGKVSTPPAALLTQHPGDHLMHDTIGADVPSSELADRHPRDVSGGERQRSALEIVLGAAAEVLLLDEPTRGMDPQRRDALAERLNARHGVTIVATHDPEFAAAFATRVILLGDGRPVADAAPHEVLAGGWYFATQVARVLGGAGGALTPEQGAALLQRVPA